ncbi:MAG: hypothetical protein U0325_00985 [Polyangiales bacterium]
MSKRWSYAVLVVAMGCGNTPINNAPIDAQVGSDVVGQDTGGGGQDVVDAGGGRTDVVDAGGGRADVVDAAMGADVVDAGSKPTDAGMTVPDGGGGMDGGGMTDGGGTATDASDAAMAPDVRSLGCAMPLSTITLPGTVAPIVGVTGGTSTIASAGCQSNASGPENVYTLTLTAPTGVLLSTENSNTNFDTVVSIRRTCGDAMTQVACDDDGGDMPGTSSIVRTALPAGTYSVIVDGYNGQSGRYTLSASTFDIDANAICANATALTTSGLMAQNLARGGNPASACVTGGSGQHWYSISVPANTQATVRATPTGMTPMWAPVVRILDTCDATTCLANATGAAGMAGSAVVANTTNATRTYLVAVNATSATATGTFDLALTTQMIVPGASCEMAIDVPAGMGRTGESTMNGGPANTVCQTGLGTQRWYRVSIPAGQRLNATATPMAMSGRRAAMRFVDSCTATTCLASTGGTTNTASTLGINNAGTTARTVLLSVSGESTTMPMTFDLATALVPIMPSGVCESPVALPNGMAVSGDTGRGLARPTRCQTTDMSNEVFFSVTVPAGQRTAVLVQPAMGATWRPRVRGLTGCAATGCFANIAATADGGPATLNLDNPSQLPREMIVSVSTTTAATGGAFTITATNGALPTPPMPYYTLSSIPAACDDLSMGTALPPSTGSWTDDNVSANNALPFTFRFFDADTTHYTVTSNGFMQLFANAMGTGLTTFSNTTLPATSTPNGLIAAFWDDLYSIDNTTGVRTATLGTMPNRRFVVGWINWETGEGSTGEALTFQAKLFETTRVIEIHHCSIAGAGGRSRGNSATIGVEDAMGMRGNLIGYEYEGIAATGRGYRLTPPM